MRKGTPSERISILFFSGTNIRLPGHFAAFSQRNFAHAHPSGKHFRSRKEEAAACPFPTLFKTGVAIRMAIRAQATKKGRRSALLNYRFTV